MGHCAPHIRRGAAERKDGVKKAPNRLGQGCGAARARFAATVLRAL